MPLELRTCDYRISRPPPSVNDCLIPRGNRLINSTQYRQWKDLAARELALEQSGRGRLRAGYWRMEVFVPGVCRADLDNISVKIISDALVRSKRVPDDSYLVDQRSRFWDGDHVRIFVREEDIDTWATIKRASSKLRNDLLQQRYQSTLL